MFGLFKKLFGREADKPATFKQFEPASIKAEETDSLPLLNAAVLCAHSQHTEDLGNSWIKTGVMNDDLLQLVRMRYEFDIPEEDFKTVSGTPFILHRPAPNKYWFFARRGGYQDVVAAVKEWAVNSGSDIENTWDYGGSMDAINFEAGGRCTTLLSQWAVNVTASTYGPELGGVLEINVDFKAA